MVPGILPTGCIPIMLTLYASPKSPNKADYDRDGCLTKTRPVPMGVQPVQLNRAPNLEGPKFKISSLLGLLINIFWSTMLLTE